MKDMIHQSELHDLFWDRLDDITAGMLSAGPVAATPMSHQARREDRALWFITARGTDLAQAATEGATAQYVTACRHGQLYARIDGRLETVTDPAKLDELWSPIAAAWFEDGRQDEDVQLMKFTPATAEIWATDGAARFFYEIAKGNLTDDRPDMGEHGTLTF